MSDAASSIPSGPVWAARAEGGRLFGIQSWVALPRDHEESEPALRHYAEADLPVVEGEGAPVRVSPVKRSARRLPSLHPWQCSMPMRGSIPAPPSLSTQLTRRGDLHYTTSGEIEIAVDRFGPGQLLLFRPGDRVAVRGGGARFMLLGGEPVDGPRRILWNFVTSRSERIEQAKADWKAARFDSVPGETEFVPLPEQEPKVAFYP